MNNVFDTRSRLFLEELEKLSEWLSNDAPRAPTALEEQTVRLLAMAVVLLRQHQVNEQGQCQFCGWTWRFLGRRRRCTVYQALDLGMGQSLDVVWWRVFESMGREVSLTEVRAWMAGRAADAGPPFPLRSPRIIPKTRRRSCWKKSPIETTLTGGGGGGGAGNAGRCRRSGS